MRFYWDVPTRDTWEFLGSECRNQPIDKFDELLERWQNRITIKNLVLAKRYLKSEIELGLIFNIFSSFPEVGTEFIAIFKCDSRFTRGSLAACGRAHNVRCSVL